MSDLKLLSVSSKLFLYLSINTTNTDISKKYYLFTPSKNKTNAIMTSQATTQPNNLLPETNTEPFTVFDDFEEFDNVTESPSYDYTIGNSDISNRSKTSLNDKCKV